MKNPKNIIFILLILLFCNPVLYAQEIIDKNTETITGVFDDFDGENFIFNYTNEDKEEDMMLFSKVNPEVLEKHNLSEEKYKGKTFNITFISETETEDDEDGDEQEYTVRTIVDLKLLD